MSTQVGQNIKLLTYVSIFYLPLSFCTVGLSHLIRGVIIESCPVYLEYFRYSRVLRSGGYNGHRWSWDLSRGPKHPGIGCDLQQAL